MYKLITFDANGTLLKLRYPLGHIYSEVAKEFGLSSNGSVIEKRFKVAWKHMSKDHPNFGLSSIGWEDWWKNMVFQSFNHDKSNERTLEKVANKLVDVFRSHDGWVLADDCAETLHLLKSLHVKMGVISNFDPRLHEVLKSLDIDKYFDSVITSYEARVMKPDVKIFRLAEEIFKISPRQDGDRECLLHVGNVADIDYKGALNAGWDAALICSYPNSLLSTSTSIDSNKVFKSLFEINEFLKKKL